MPLTNTAIRTAKPAEKPYKLADEKGLFLLVNPNGGKWWAPTRQDMAFSDESHVFYLLMK